MVKLPGRRVYVDRTEVSRLDYLRMVAALRWGIRTQQLGNPREPALLTFDEAKAYCDWAGKRLITFAEWQAVSGPDAKKSMGADPEPVDAAPPNALGIFGLENGVFEWTQTAAKEPGYKLVGELDMDPPQLGADEETKLGVRCAADSRKVSSFGKSPTKVRLFGGNGVCARLESTRETYCWSGLPSALADAKESISRQPVRVSSLDTALAVSQAGVLWSTAVTGPDLMYLRAAQDDPFRLLETDGELFTLGRSGTLIDVLPIGSERQYARQVQQVDQAFEAQGGLLTKRAGTWRWDGRLGPADYHGDPTELQLPVEPSAVLVLENETCLRSGAKLTCGVFTVGKFETARVVPLAVAAVTTAGPSCVLTDAGALHCVHEKLSSEVLARPLPSPVLDDVVELQSGRGLVCALDRQDHVSCTTRELQNEQLARGKTSSSIRFERIQLPEPK